MANAVAAKKKQEVAPADLMSMFEEQSGAGLENLTQDDLALPFIKILIHWPVPKLWAFGILILLVSMQIW